MIPKILHFVWIGGRAKPEWAECNLAEFRRLNPGYEIRVHGEDALLPEYREAFDAAKQLCAKADLIRYSALERWGGWYFDLDFWPFRPLADIERAYHLDGSHLFITRQHGNKNPTLVYSNAVLAAGVECGVWPRIKKYVQAHTPPTAQFVFGPGMMTDLVEEHPRCFVVGDWPWFYPAAIGHAGQVYHACANFDNRYAQRIAPTGGQLPFAMHLWAGGGDRLLDTVVKRRDQFATLPPPPGDTEFSGLRVTFPMIQIQWEDATQPFRAIAEGLTALGCDVDIPLHNNTPDLSRADLMVQWNGRKGHFRDWTAEARRHNLPILHIEHGFFDRRAYTQMDHLGLLHWTSWAHDFDRPAPEGGARRLADVWPHPLLPFPKRRQGYVLVLGQVPGDSQMDDSEIALSTPLEKMVARSRTKDVRAVFRAHPRVRIKAGKYLPTCEAATLEQAVAGARFAVTINSNAGNECLAMGCPVMAFGPALYNNAGVALPVTSADFALRFRDMLDGWRPDEERGRNYLEWLACRQWNQDEFRAGPVLTARLREALN